MRQLPSCKTDRTMDISTFANRKCILKDLHDPRSSHLCWCNFFWGIWILMVLEHGHFVNYAAIFSIFPRMKTRLFSKGRQHFPKAYFFGGLVCPYTSPHPPSRQQYILLATLDWQRPLHSFKQEIIWYQTLLFLRSNGSCGYPWGAGVYWIFLDIAQQARRI